MVSIYSFKIHPRQVTRECQNMVAIYSFKIHPRQVTRECQNMVSIYSFKIHPRQVTRECQNMVAIYSFKIHPRQVTRGCQNMVSIYSFLIKKGSRCTRLFLYIYFRKISWFFYVGMRFSLKIWEPVCVHSVDVAALAPVAF